MSLRTGALLIGLTTAAGAHAEPTTTCGRSLASPGGAVSGTVHLVERIHQERQPVESLLSAAGNALRFHPRARLEGARPSERRALFCQPHRLSRRWRVAEHLDHPT